VSAAGIVSAEGEAEGRDKSRRAVAAPTGGQHVRETVADDARRKASIRRTGLLLFAIALLFFFGIIASRFIDSPLVSTGVVGGAVLLYLIVAIGRHLWK
jgi:hypothetical protein